MQGKTTLHLSMHLSASGDGYEEQGDGYEEQGDGYEEQGDGSDNRFAHLGDATDLETEDSETEQVDWVSQEGQEEGKGGLGERREEACSNVLQRAPTCSNMLQHAPILEEASHNQQHALCRDSIQQGFTCSTV